MAFVNYNSGVPNMPLDDLDQQIEWVDENGSAHLDSIRDLLESGNIREFQKWWVTTLYERLKIPRTSSSISEMHVRIMLDFLRMSLDSRRYDLGGGGLTGSRNRPGGIYPISPSSNYPI